jgi:Putative transposase/Transposase zinc-binding domain
MAGGLEVADVFRRHGPEWRAAQAGHLDRMQCRVMGAIEACRTAALGGHVRRCADCGHAEIAYNSCRNRHCPKCQGSARAAWVAARRAELLPVPYFHVVFTLPAPVAAIAFQNKAVAYALLFRAAAETLRTIAADPRHLGAEIGGVAVLHTWGQALQHHPHVHCIVPGGGLAPDGTRWVACPPSFFLSVKVLGRLFRRLFVERLARAFATGELRFFGELAPLADADAFAAHCARLRQIDWVVYAKRPFGGPEQVLAYLGRYTHRVAIANSRLVAMTDATVSFRWKDYRHEGRNKVMTLDAGEFMRRFLLHVLPPGFHRIRHFGLLANGHRAARLALCRGTLAAPATGEGQGADADADAPAAEPSAATTPPGLLSLCPRCGSLHVIRTALPRAPPGSAKRRR